MMGGVDFPTWFNTGYYGGMACCMLSIAGNALYMALRKRGTTHQLTAAIVACVLSALLLLPALFWFNLRFSNASSTISTTEVALALLYVVLWGWLLPIGISSGYFFLSTPRIATASLERANQKRTTREDPSQARPVRLQPGTIAPFVYDPYTPWGWLEYSSGSFHGQRLELKHSIITMGRDENCDIWIDDEMASRHHAELSWQEENVYLTDCDSLNGIRINGQRIRDFQKIEPNDMLEIGEYRFTFFLADRKQAIEEQNDPLVHHVWRSIEGALGGDSGKILSLPVTAVPEEQKTASQEVPQSKIHWQETDKLARQMAIRPRLNGLVVVKDGEIAGQTFLIDQPVLTVGRGIECDIIINDTSISRQHIQLLRQAEGDYVQDLTSRNGTSVNGAILQNPRLLQSGDSIQIGNIRLEYAALQSTPTTPPPLGITPPPFGNSTSGPLPLRLPSRPIQNR